MKDKALALRVSRRSIAINILLTAFKLFAGIAGRSGAMVSDAVHSLSDIMGTVIVMAGVKAAANDSDKEHPYGHERFECVAAIILAVILFATGLMIGWSGVQKIITRGAPEIPAAVALAAAVISVAVKESMYWYVRAAAKKINSGALMAEAWHHRSDALSSVGSFIGILGARIGFPVLDPLASVVICLFILKVAVDIFKDAVNKMTDRACDDEMVNAIREAALSEPGVIAVDAVNTRLFGSRIYVDVEITATRGALLVDAHETAHNVHDLIETRFPQVKHCTVHVNPAPE